MRTEALCPAHTIQNVKLRELEDSLLAKISSVEGSILDDNSVIKSMEEIKTEGKIVEEAVTEGEIVMAEMERDRREVIVGRDDGVCFLAGGALG